MKNLSAFRMLFLVLMALSAGMYILDGRPDAGNVPHTLVVALASAGALAAELSITVRRRLMRRGRDTAARPRNARGPFERLFGALFRYRLANPDQERLDSELKVARDILFSLVPGSFPPYSGWREFDLHARFSPAREVGGDYYDFFMLNPDKLVVVVGDVSGKGVPAALYMAVIRTAFRTLARRAVDPSLLMRELNEMLVRDNHSGLYVTLICFFVNLPDGKAEYVIAGHPAPMWLKAGEGGTAVVDSPRDSFIGMQAGLDFPKGTMTLGRGDTLLLYTDGVTEAQGAGEDGELGYAGLQAMFGKAGGEASCRSAIEALAAGLDSFTGGGEQADDTTLLAFRYWGPGGKMGGDDCAPGYSSTPPQG